MGGCGGSGRQLYVITAAGIAKIVAVITGSAPVIIAFILYDHYTHNPRPVSEPHIIIPASKRAAWEIGFLIVVAAALAITVINILFYTCFKCLSRNIWTKRLDCLYFALGGEVQAAVGFIMVGSARSSSATEPVQLKYAAGFLGIVSGIVYWAAATLVNQD